MYILFIGQQIQRKDRDYFINIFFYSLANRYSVKTGIILLIYFLFIGQQIQRKDQEPAVAASRSCRSTAEMYLRSLQCCGRFEPVK